MSQNEKLHLTYTLTKLKKKQLTSIMNELNIRRKFRMSHHNLVLYIVNMCALLRINPYDSLTYKRHCQTLYPDFALEA